MWISPANPAFPVPSCPERASAQSPGVHPEDTIYRMNPHPEGVQATAILFPPPLPPCTLLPSAPTSGQQPDHPLSTGPKQLNYITTMSDPFNSPEGATAEAPSIQQAADDLREAAGQKARQVVQSAEDSARQLKDATSEKAQQFREIAGEQWQETRVKAREVHTSTEDYIREHPTKSILVAAGVGFLFGLIVRR